MRLADELRLKMMLPRDDSDAPALCPQTLEHPRPEVVPLFVFSLFLAPFVACDPLQRRLDSTLEIDQLERGSGTRFRVNVRVRVRVRG